MAWYLNPTTKAAATASPPSAAEFCDGGAAWRDRPASPHHPAAGARWRFTEPRRTCGPHEFDIELRSLSGARALRAVHTGAMAVGEHSHDWPTLLLHTVGSYAELYQEGEVRIATPAAVLHPAGSAHANTIGPDGMEAIAIHFDPRWLRRAGHGLRLDRSQCWIGGAAGAAARGLAAAWSDPARTEGELAVVTARFLRFALAAEAQTPQPPWLDHVLHALDEPAPPSTRALARRLDLNPAWLARTYRACVGEGLRETLRRRRVERAAALLRGSSWPLAEIAVAAGFCDQSHMNRALRLLTGRTPVQVRAERNLLEQVVFADGSSPEAARGRPLQTPGRA